MIKRWWLFALTNMAVLAVVTIIMMVITTATGHPLSSWTALWIVSALVGMVGAGISLVLSKWMALRATGAHIITQPRTPAHAWLLSTVRQLAQEAKVGCPDVAIYPSLSPNAFATGARRNHALVAVSEGLLSQLNQEQIRAVLAHEISHIANGDMVTMTLLQGVINTFVMVLARVVGTVVDQGLLGQRSRGLGYTITVIVAQIMLGALANLIVMWFSRQREFRADAGAARLTTPQAMIAALQALSAPTPQGMPPSLSALAITAPPSSWWSSHPPIADRIAALRQCKGDGVCSKCYNGPTLTDFSHAAPHCSSSARPHAAFFVPGACRPPY